MSFVHVFVFPDQVDYIVVGTVIQEVKTSNVAREVCSPLPPSLPPSLV